MEKILFNGIPELSIEDAENFDIWEVECNDNCGQAIARGKVVYLLQVARTRSGVPFHITSWNRCELWNAYVGGVDDSSHVTGWAVDIVMSDNSATNYKILEALMHVGFPIIQINTEKRYFHVDLNPDKIWWRLLL